MQIFKEIQSFSKETKSWQRNIRYQEETNGNFRSEKYTNKNKVLKGLTDGMEKLPNLKK